MRRQLLIIIASLVPALAFACGEVDDPVTPTGDASAEGAATGTSSGSSGSSSGSSGSSGADSSVAPPGDASSGDAAKVSDASPSDAASDAAKIDAGPDATVDAAPPAPTNLARQGVATATSEYGGYPASSVNDGVLTTGWYVATGICTLNDAGTLHDCPATSVEIALTVVRTIGRVKVFGNRDGYPTGYDTLTGRIELLDSADVVLYTADVTMSRGAEPNGDVDHAIAPAKANVKKIRVTVLTGEASGPGIAEIEAYAN